MNWFVTLTGSRADVKRLVEELPGELCADSENPRQVCLAFVDPEGSVVGEDAGHAAKLVIDATVGRINGLAKLRWGRVFEGVTVSAVRAVDASGSSTQFAFVGTAVAHMFPEDFADMVERLGHPRPPVPEGWDEIKALDLDAVQSLSESNPAVARALHLLTLALTPGELDWVSAYSTLEIVRDDLGSKGADGQSLGLWSKRELGDFNATANSPEVLGLRARHGKMSGLEAARMTDNDATWFVRRVVARWVCWLLDDGAGD